MKHLRPKFTLVALAAGLAMAPAVARAQAQQLTPLFEDDSAHAASAVQGYLGIGFADIDAGKQQELRLKDTHGAVITLIDHDAPAGQAGLRVNDVIMQVNGQNIDNADGFRRILKGMSPGTKVALQFYRDGALQAVTVELVDSKAMEQKMWNQLGSTSDVPEMGFVSGNSMPNGFHLPSFGSTLKVGALVEPLTTQMAAALGVGSGLMVKQVTRKSEAETAGLRAFDVILKVGSDGVATAADWDRALRTNQGKPVQVTILRDKKQQTLTLVVDSKHQKGQKGELDRKKMTAPRDPSQMAQLEWKAWTEGRFV